MQTPGTICVNGVDIKKTTQFTYLGSRLDSLGSPLHDVTARCNASWTKWRLSTGVLCDRRMPVKLKSMVYHTIIRPVALYGAECRPSTRRTDHALHCMEMRMSRWSLGLTRKDKIRNEIIRSKLGIRPIMDKVMERRLRWYGHVLRMKPPSVALSAMYLQVAGTRPRGRPHKRWMDCVMDDLNLSGLCMEDAADRAKWRRGTAKADPDPGNLMLGR